MSVNIWTIPALKEHFQALLEAQAALIAAQARRFDDLRAADKTAVDAALTSAQTAVKAALEAAEKAVVKAEISTADKLKLLNELRTGVATSAELGVIEGAVRRVERLVYIGVGLAISASIAIPLLLRK